MTKKAKLQHFWKLWNLVNTAEVNCGEISGPCFQVHVIRFGVFIINAWKRAHWDIWFIPLVPILSCCRESFPYWFSHWVCFVKRPRHFVNILESTMQGTHCLNRHWPNLLNHQEQIGSAFWSLVGERSIPTFSGGWRRAGKCQTSHAGIRPFLFFLNASKSAQGEGEGYPSSLAPEEGRRLSLLGLWIWEKKKQHWASRGFLNVRYQCQIGWGEIGREAHTHTAHYTNVSFVESHKK